MPDVLLRHIGVDANLELEGTATGGIYLEQMFRYLKRHGFGRKNVH